MALSVENRARRVRVLALDVDGVLTDAGMYYGPQGEVMKKFNTRDGQGIALVREAGIHVAIVTREETEIVTVRAAKLAIEDVFQGARDKLAVVERLVSERGCTLEDVCYVGDDVGDLDVMRAVGLAVAVADALPSILEVAHLTTARPGGAGAVREVCDLLLSARHTA